MNDDSPSLNPWRPVSSVEASWGIRYPIYQYYKGNPEVYTRSHDTFMDDTLAERLSLYFRKSLFVGKSVCPVDQCIAFFIRN